MWRGLVCAAAAAALFGQSAPELFRKAPPAVDEALRARITKFYQLQMEGKGRAAEALVAEDTKDFFYNSGKPKYLSFEIRDIEYTDNFTKANATVLANRIVMMPGFTKPMPIPELSRWKLVDGEWYWYMSQDDLLNTPFGRSKPTASTGSSMPIIPTQDEMAKVVQGIKPDKTSVELQAEKESSGRFVIANPMSAPINLSLEATQGPGFTARLDKTEVPPGGSAILTVEWKPGLRPAPRWSQMVVHVQQTNQAIPLRVKFANQTSSR